MKLRSKKCDVKDKSKFCLLLFRQLNRFCRNPKSLLYPLYGAKKAKCDFGSAVEIGYLYTKYHVEEMNEPFLARYKGNGNFNTKNCFFYDSKVTIKQLLKQIYGWA